MTDSALGQAAMPARDFRPIAFVLVFLLSWIGVDPFPDLTTGASGEADQAASLFNLLAYLAVGTLAVGLAFSIRPNAFVATVRPVTCLLLGWLVVPVITSADPQQSARRLALTLIVMALAVSAIQLPMNLRQFAKLLAAMSLLVIGLCLGGVLIAPHFAVHQQ